MKFVGEYLKSVRIQKKCTIEELSIELKINTEVIKSIEIDVFPAYLKPVYMMGYIRSYAIFFDLDADDLIETFKIQTDYNKLIENKQISKPVKTISLFSPTKTFYFASISIISISFYFMFIRSNNVDQEYALTPNLPENLQSSLEKIEMNLDLAQKNNQKSKSFSKLDQIRKHFEEESFFSNSSSAMASKSKDPPLKIDDVKITLSFLNPTWIQLRDIHDSIIISKLMEKGDAYSYYLLENLNLTSGNAGNIIVSFNGEILGKLGKTGDVIESIIIDKNFKN